MGDRNLINSIRLDEAEVEAILGEMDDGTVDPADLRRDAKRWRYRKVVAVLSVPDKHNRRTDYVVAPRNLSATGFSALHGGFLHPGTRCVLGLRRLDGAVGTMRCRIVRCRLVRANLHELGVQFDEAINPARYIKFAERVFHRERIDLDDLQGTLLVVAPTVLEQRMIASHVHGSRIDLIYARSTDDAASMLGETVRAILIDHAVDRWEGIEAVERLRSLAFGVPMIFQTSSEDRSVYAAAMDAGADEVLEKPYTTELIHQTLAEFMSVDGMRSSSTSVHFIVSSAGENGVSLGLLESFVEELPRLLDGFDAGDLEMLERDARDLAGTAASLGFAPLSDAALGVAVCVQTEAERVGEAIDRLRSISMRCKAAP